MAKKIETKKATKKVEDVEDENIIDIEKKKGERVSIQSGLNYHDFVKNSEFTGQYVRDQWADVVNKETKETEHKCIGYVFVTEDGEEVLIGNSFAVDKALNTSVNGLPAKEGKFMWFITFMGKKSLANGRSVNQFKVEIE